MKRLVFTLSIILGLSMASFAQGGLFERGDVTDSYYNRGGNPLVPNHGQTGNQDADVPLGGGAAVLITLGAAYAIFSKKSEARSKKSEA